MKRKFPQITIVLLLCISLLCPPIPVQACGPFFPSITFTYLSFPGVPLKRFGAGELGILQPTFEPRYLVVAYRNLDARPLITAEQKAALYPCTSPCDPNTNDEKAIEDWQIARGKITSVPVPTFNGPDRPIVRHMSGGYMWMDNFPNCLDPAFETAADTLSRRVDQFGVDSPAVKEWVAAQDAVFSNCSGGPKEAANYPAPADPSLPEIIRADRSYQIAAAHFYAGDFDGAGKLFQEVAGDSKSQWQVISSLLVARSLIRKATLNGGKEGVDEDVLTDAERALEKILTDPSLYEIHPAATRLQGFVLFRLDPKGRLRTLGEKLAKPKDATLTQDLYDYQHLLSNGADAGAPNSSWNGRGARKNPSRATSQEDPMTDWILSVRTKDVRSHQYALDKWKQTGSLAWLVAAVIHAEAGEAMTTDLIAASRKIAPQSPAYVTVTFHRLRLEAMSGQRDEARSELDDFLKTFQPHLSRSDSNLFAALRMSLARNLEDLLHFAMREPAVILPSGGYDDDGPFPVLDDVGARKLEKENADAEFDFDGAWMLTRGLPTAELLQAIQSKELPESLRNRVAAATWVRAVMLNDQASALQLAPIVGLIKTDDRPESDVTDSSRLRKKTDATADDLAQLMKEYAAAQGRASRQFQGILTILRMPGFRPFVEFGISREAPFATIDSFRDNWWSNLEYKKGASPYEQVDWSAMSSPVGDPSNPGILTAFYPNGEFALAAFLTDAERAETDREWSKLLATGVGANWLAQQAIAWAKAHPDDTRVPEALHLSVRALRYAWTGNGDLSKEAFDLLHKRYPTSEWTKKTPYWFN
jgi:hypothetical protein